MQIRKENDKIIFEIDCWSKRVNPYMDENADIGQYPTLVGIILKDTFGNEEMGFAKVIDMDYKDKGDQETDIMIHYWDGDEKEFIKLCKELEIDIIKYPECAYCGQSIFGSFTVGEKGNQCFECSDIKKLK
jgi:hypothetical protein